MTMDLYTHALEEHQSNEMEKLILDIKGTPYSGNGV